MCGQAARTTLRRVPAPVLVFVLVLALLVPASTAADDGVGLTLTGAIPERVRAAVDLERATIPDLQAALESGAVTSVDLVRLYLERIAAYDDGGPSLNSILAINPNALDTARELDQDRRRGRIRGPLRGIPILLKDIIDTGDMPTAPDERTPLVVGPVPRDQRPVHEARRRRQHP